MIWYLETEIKRKLIGVKRGEKSSCDKLVCLFNYIANVNRFYVYCRTFYPVISIYV